MRYALRGGVVLAFAAMLTAQAALGQAWEKKPYTEWSKDETVKVLSDSPWATEEVITDVRASTAGNNLSTGNNNTGSKVTYQIQIRSAQPIRAAIVHMQQLSPRYQQMPADQKQRIDANADAFINGKSDEISFWVNYSCDVPTLAMDLKRYWETQTAGTMANKIFLQVSGSQKLDPTYFGPGPNNSFEIRFPRPKDISADGSLTLQFNHPGIGPSTRKVLAEFKLKKMKVNGTPSF
ncbi:MAG TPA: hypothetical protein VFM10_00295 [Terriglobales bacterium]|jgi:hypothetical protein|nr:hypothetical protein [Terriglobales bacterium]